MDLIKLNELSRLIQIVASQGVYALTVLFLILYERRAVSDYRRAISKKDKIVFRNRLWIATSMSVILTILASLIWMYATFCYKPEPLIKGTITGLVEYNIEPEAPEDDAKLLQTFTLERNEYNFYKNSRINSDGHLEYGWVFFASPKDGPMLFKICHEWTKIKYGNSTACLSISDNKIPVTDCYSVDYELGWDDIDANKGVDLKYIQNRSDNTKLGKLMYWSRSKQRFMPVDIIANNNLNNVATYGSTYKNRIAMRTSISLNIINNIHSYSQERRKDILEALSSNEYIIREWGLDQLIKMDKDAFELIERFIKRDRIRSHEYGKIIHYFDIAVRLINKRGTTSTQNINMLLGEYMFLNENYEYAIYYLSKILNETLDIYPKYIYYLGFTNAILHKYNIALEYYNRYINHSDNDDRKAITFTAIGNVYYEIGNNKLLLEDMEGAEREFIKAIENYKKSMELKKDYADAINKIAYLYAETSNDKDILSEAKRMIEEMLVIYKHKYEYWETHGIIMIKLGKYEDAIKSLKKANELAPNNKDVLKHLKEAEMKIKTRDSL